MSWVFLTVGQVYKLKKPVRAPYLDFTTLEKRKLNCVAEYTLNRRLAPDVYKGVVPLVMRDDRKLAIGGPGVIVDWLVVMQRLDPAASLEPALLSAQFTARGLNPLIATFARFYRHAPKVFVPPAELIMRWRRALRDNRTALLDSRAQLPTGIVRRLDCVQARFLQQHSDMFAVRARLDLVEGHGDLRPEHIWPGPPVRVIDCLEFNRQLRTVDPLDEISSFSLECERLGDRHFGEYIRRWMMGPRNGRSERLFLFYRCYRASLRARLAIAHLFEPHPATPAKWPKIAREYLELGLKDAIRLEHLMN